MSYNCRQIKRSTLDQKVSQQYFCQPTKTSQRKFKNVRIRFLLQCTQGFSNNLGLQNQHNSRIKQTKIFCQSQSSSNISQSQQDVRQQNLAQNQDQQQNDDEDSSDYELEGDNVDENFISNVQFTQDKYSLDQGQQNDITQQYEQIVARNNGSKKEYQKRTRRSPKKFPQQAKTQKMELKPQISKKPDRRKIREEDLNQRNQQDQILNQIENQLQIDGSSMGYEEWESMVSGISNVTQIGLSQQQQIQSQQFSSKGLPEWLASSLPNIVWQIVLQWQFIPLKISSISQSFKLRYANGEEITNGYVVPIRGPTIIGGDAQQGCDVVINSPFVSARHLRLEVIQRKGEQKLVAVADAKNTNETYINGNVIQRKLEIPVQEGDVISLGSKEEADNCTIQFEKADFSDDISAIGLAMHQYCNNQDISFLEYKQDAFKEVNEVNRWKGKEAAVKLLKSYISDMPTQWQLWWLWAMWEAKSRNFGCARTLYRAAYEALEVFIFRQNSSFTNLSYKYRRLFSKEMTYILRDWGLAEWKQGYHSSARRLWQRGLSLGGKFQGTLTRHLYHVWTRCELENGDVFRARQIVSGAVKLFPRNPDILNIAGFVDIVGNRFDRAAKILRLAAEIQPDHKYILTNLAKAEWECGNIDKARQVYRVILQQNPYSSKTLHRWAVQEEKVGNLSAAIEMQKRALELDPKSKTTIKNREHLACMYMLIGQHGEAQKMLDEGLKLHWGNARLHTAMAQLELDGKNYDKCIKHVNIVLQLQPKYVDALKVLIQCYKKQGLLDMAAKVDKKVRKVCTQELLIKQRLRT